MQDMLEAAIKRGAYPIKLTLPEGQLEIFNGRGFDRKGYAAYLRGNSLIPSVGVGSSPEIAFQDIFTDRTQKS